MFVPVGPIFAVIVSTATWVAGIGSLGAGSSMTGGSGAGTFTGGGMSPTCPGVGPPVTTNSPGAPEEDCPDPVALLWRVLVAGVGVGGKIGVLPKSKAALRPNAVSVVALFACHDCDLAMPATTCV
jgi:hypothetical protein